MAGSVVGVGPARVRAIAPPPPRNFGGYSATKSRYISRRPTIRITTARFFSKAVEDAAPEVLDVLSDHLLPDGRGAAEGMEQAGDLLKKRIMEGSSTPGSSAPATSRGKSPPRPSGGRTDRREPLRRCTPVELTRPLPSTVVRAPPKKGTSLKQAGGHGKKGTGSQAALVAKLKAEGLR